MAIIHILPRWPGACLACGKIFEKDNYPGSFFQPDNGASWAASPIRCMPELGWGPTAADGTLGIVKLPAKKD
jgi:hypothetical protein